MFIIAWLNRYSPINIYGSLNASLVTEFGTTEKILTVPFTKFFRCPGSLYVSGTTIPEFRYASSSSTKYCGIALRTSLSIEYEVNNETQNVMW